MVWTALKGAVDTGASVLLGAFIAALLAFAPKAWAIANAFVHGKATMLVREALANAAQIAVQKVSKGEMTDDRAIRWMMDYAKIDRLPETVAKLKLSDATLRDMSLAAYYRVITERKAAAS